MKSKSLPTHRERERRVRRGERERHSHRRIATIMYHVIAAFLWASSRNVVDGNVDATCSKFNDMFSSFFIIFFFVIFLLVFSLPFFRSILFEALCMVCKFFTWPHFCILCGNTLEASGRLSWLSHQAACQNNKMLAKWARGMRQETDDKVCEKAIQLGG